MKAQSAFILLVFLCLALPACASNAAAKAPENKTVIQNTEAPTVMPTATITLTATPAGTPTPNAVATKNMLEAQLAAAVSTTTMEQLNAEGTVAALHVTETLVSAVSTEQQGYKDGTATATAAIAATQAVKEIATQNAIQTATAQAPIIQREQIVNDWLPVILGIAIICGVVFVLVLAYAVIRVAEVKVRQIQELRAHFREITADTPAPFNSETLNVKLDNRDSYGWGAVDWTTCPIDKETLNKVSELIAAGYRYTEKQMTGAEHPLTKDGTFDSFGQWMVKNEIAIQMDDGRYVIQHRDFFEQILKQ